MGKMPYEDKVIYSSCFILTGLAPDFLSLLTPARACMLTVSLALWDNALEREGWGEGRGREIEALG